MKVIVKTKKKTYTFFLIWAIIFPVMIPEKIYIKHVKPVEFVEGANE